MGFIKGAIDAVGGTFADQWLDYFTPPTNLGAGAVIYKAVFSETNRGRGSKGIYGDVLGDITDMGKELIKKL